VPIVTEESALVDWLCWAKDHAEEVETTAINGASKHLRRPMVEQRNRF
jgi:hypothetical protein